MDRRDASRFPLSEEVTYTAHCGAVTTSGIGKSLNLGGGGILLTTEEHLHLGCTVVLKLAWPARLDGRCLLAVIATGTVTRSEKNRAAVKFEDWEFRRSPVSADESDGSLAVGRGRIDASRS
jgi:hypothetical protein